MKNNLLLFLQIKKIWIRLFITMSKSLSEWNIIKKKISKSDSELKQFHDFVYNTIFVFFVLVFFLFFTILYSTFWHQLKAQFQLFLIANALICQFLCFLSVCCRICSVLSSLSKYFCVWIALWYWQNLAW